MDPIVLAAGTALVTAMANDGWQQARNAVVELWRRFRPEQAESVDAELIDVRTQALAAREAGDADTERALVGSWQLRLAQVLRQNPEFAVELRRILDESLMPALPGSDQAHIGSIVMNATANDQGRVHQAGRDLHITDS